MAKRSLDSIFRSWESSYVVEPMFLARLDGWHFRTFTRGLEKPFDRKLWEALQETAIRFFPVFRPAFAYAHSDEVTFVFTKATLFDRVEKLDSLMAGVYSSTFTSLMGRPAAFDCRVIGIARESNITAYLAWTPDVTFSMHLQPLASITPTPHSVASTANTPVSSVLVIIALRGSR